MSSPGLFVLLSATLAGASAPQAGLAHEEIVGALRVQALSPTLVRIERRGPGGFEDRPTFHIVDRAWPGAALRREERDGVVTLHSTHWRIVIPQKADALTGVRIENPEGKPLYTITGAEGNSVWLPAPGHMPPAWAIADTPRIVPAPWGLTPAPRASAAGPTNGWDLANDAPDVYVFLPNGDDRQLRRDVLKLTGATPMPPLFALGLIDSRYHAYTEKTALEQIDAYRRRKIPLDVFVVDTDWRIGASHGYAPDPKCFPDMPRFLREAHARHVRLMFNDHPEPQARTALDRAELQYRYDGLAGLLRAGADAWWYDRNWRVGLVEPAPGLRKEVWGMMLYRDITQQVRPGQRPLVMSNVDGIDNGERSNPPNVASHRFPIQWTGDTTAHWHSLRRGVENAVFSGVRALHPWLSEDLGGHAGRPATDLYVRFVQYGCLSPITRLHCTTGQVRHPWAYGKQAERIVGDYVRLRYRLLPLLYAAARQAHETGEPILRRLDLEFPAHAEAARDDEYLLGHGLLVAPIISGEDPVAVPAELFTTSDGQPGLRGEYFDNTEVRGKPVLTRTDAALDFSWGDESPGKHVPADHFSCRWTGRIGPIPAGRGFKLVNVADDGVRVRVDGRLVIDHWEPQDSVTSVADFVLKPGSTHSLQVEHYEGSGNAKCRLLWAAVRPDGPANRPVWIPPGEWTDLWSGRVYIGPRMIEAEAALEQTPMFARSGAIIPLAPEMQYTGEKPWDPMTLEIFAPSDAPAAERSAANGSKAGEWSSQATLYEDDGISNAYREGRFRKTMLRCVTDPNRKAIRITIDAARGDYPGALQARRWVLRVRPPRAWKGTPQQVRANGTPIPNWRVLAKAARLPTPFATSGPAMDGDIVELALDSTPVSVRTVVELSYLP